MTSADSVLGMKCELIDAKVRAGIPITSEDVNSLIFYGVEMTADCIEKAVEKICSTCICINNNEAVKDILSVLTSKSGEKTPWYKKVWNWITKPFKKNK